MSKIINTSSLSTLVSGSFVIIVTLTLISTFASYSRLQEFNLIVSDITDNSLHEATKATKINSILKEVLYLSERLTTANNQVSRRISLELLMEQTTELGYLLQSSESSTYLNSQLDTIKNEVAALNLLVTTKINNRLIIQNKVNQSYELQNKIINDFNELGIDSRLLDNITMNVVRSVSLSHKALTLEKLQPVRQIFRDVQSKLQQISNTIAANNLTKNSDLAETLQQLHTLFLADKGLLNYKIKQLQIKGRARGRGSFLHNLIADASKSSEYSFYKTNESIIKNSRQTEKRIAEQIKWSISLACVVFILLVLTIYLINHKIVARLVSLNAKVIQRMKSHDVEIDTSGNDEISHLARSIVYFAEKVEKQRQELKALSLTDSLTGVSNRRALDERLNHDLQIAKRNQWPLSLLILDIDYFKNYNDYYGHIAGDECLVTIASILKSVPLRDSDNIARYGGEEFVILLPDTDKKGAQTKALQVIHAINRLQLPHEKSLVSSHITVSIGISTFDKIDKITLDDALKSADKALYLAKKTGRNRYCHAEPQLVSTTSKAS
ncbi:diguanylate cyclase [Pseudoalteromonas sp. MMG010]|uniref:diguanylate cyclase n=1 Tax=Pseudoalteromonas sp. MMG010 TaxID=2822685 RepID=UPI001B39D928|nr:diguanylate cyclase [Pseudoalteromonas sp. MMG010]MBQ4832050.1 diguanylate cyclase [Pseudoalteromonas sp. MMG010]